MKNTGVSYSIRGYGLVETLLAVIQLLTKMCIKIHLTKKKHDNLHLNCKKMHFIDVFKAIELTIVS